MRNNRRLARPRLARPPLPLAFVLTVLAALAVAWAISRLPSPYAAPDATRARRPVAGHDGRPRHGDRDEVEYGGVGGPKVRWGEVKRAVR